MRTSELQCTSSGSSSIPPYSSLSIGKISISLDISPIYAGGLTRSHYLKELDFSFTLFSTNLGLFIKFHSKTVSVIQQIKQTNYLVHHSNPSFIYLLEFLISGEDILFYFTKLKENLNQMILSFLQEHD